MSEYALVWTEYVGKCELCEKRWSYTVPAKSKNETNAWNIDSENRILTPHLCCGDIIIEYVKDVYEPEAKDRKVVLTDTHYKCGEHSGFPICCVEFYIHYWPTVTHKFRDEYFEQCNLAAEKLGKRYVGYVPCPTCLELSNFVEVLDCDCGHTHKLKEIE